jgi:hypothetical protein
LEIGKRAAVATSEFAQIAAKGITDLAEKTASAVSELSDKVVEAIPALKEAASEIAHQAAEKTSQMASTALSHRSTRAANEASEIGDKVASDEEVGRQILGIFMRHRIPASGTLQRNNFFDVRDGDFQRGMNKAVANNWITIDLRNRYRYQLTAMGYAVGRLIHPATRLV